MKKTDNIIVAIDECVHAYSAGKLQIIGSICETGRESNNNNVINSMI